MEPAIARQNIYVGFGLRLSQIGLAFITNVLLARLMGAENYGLFVFALSCLMLAAGLFRSGLTNFLVREVAAHFANADMTSLRALMRTLPWLLAGATLLIMAGIAGIAFLLDSQGHPAAPLLVAGTPMVAGMIAMTYWDAFTRGAGSTILSQIAEYLVRPALFLASSLCTVLLLGEEGLTPFAATLCVLGATICAAVCAYALQPRRHLVHLRKGDTPAGISFDWLSSLSILTVVSWAGLANQYVAPILLGLFSTESDVAIFSLAVQFGMLLTLGVTVMNTIQAADFSRYCVTGDRRHLQILANRSATLSFAMALVGVLIYLLLGPWIIGTFLGSEYAGVEPVLMVVTLGCLCNALSGSAGTMMLSFRQEQEVFRALLWALATNLGLSLILIGPFGALGAAVSFSISVAVWNNYLIWKTYEISGLLSLPLTANFVPRTRS